MRFSWGGALTWRMKKPCTSVVQGSAIGLGLLGMRYSQDEHDDGYPCGIDDE